MTASTPYDRLSLLRDRSGFRLNGEVIIHGFPYMPQLDERAQMRVAMWCAEITPQSLTEEQRQLIEKSKAEAAKHLPYRQARQKLNDMLSRPEYRRMWDQLDRDQQDRVRWPERYIEGQSRRGITIYPLNAAQVSALTGIDEQIVRKAAEQGSIPCVQLDDMPEPEFVSASVIAAFARCQGDQQ